MVLGVAATTPEGAYLDRRVPARGSQTEDRYGSARFTSPRGAGICFCAKLDGAPILKLPGVDRNL